MTTDMGTNLLTEEAVVEEEEGTVEITAIHQCHIVLEAAAVAEETQWDNWEPG
jgi:hypothetical protein